MGPLAAWKVSDVGGADLAMETTLLPISSAPAGSPALATSGAATAAGEDMDVAAENATNWTAPNVREVHSRTHRAPSSGRRRRCRNRTRFQRSPAATMPNAPMKAINARIAGKVPGNPSGGSDVTASARACGPDVFGKPGKRSSISRAEGLARKAG